MVSSIGERSSTQDKGKLSCLHAQGLAFPTSTVDEGKKLQEWPLLSPLLQGVLERGVPAQKEKICKKMEGLCFQVLGSWGS